jgi:hypothetical protein
LVARKKRDSLERAQRALEENRRLLTQTASSGLASEGTLARRGYDPRPPGQLPTSTYATNAERQRALQEFVWKHDLSCFKCGSRGPIEWAKTGISARGPWAICGPCANKREAG